MSSLVLCILEEDLKRLGFLEEGVHDITQDQLGALPYVFACRYFVEPNPKFKQVIPYCVIFEQHTKDFKNANIVIYERPKTGNESRLRSKLSIGFGGHTEVTDTQYKSDVRLDLHTIVWHACYREIMEEFPKKIYNELNIMEFRRKYIYSEADDVSKVHWGLLFTTHLLKPISACFSSKECANIRVMPVAELAKLDNLETWSKLIVENFLER